MLEIKITEAKHQKESMIARARTAKTSVNVNDMLSSLGGSSSVAAFDRMKEKVESLEIQAEIAGELAASNVGTNATLEKRFQSLQGNTAIEEELQRMLTKQRPNVISVTPLKELPSSVVQEQDVEYERIRKQYGPK